MTTAADDAAERAFEAALAGRPVPAEAAGLVTFAEAVRATAHQPGRPNAALAELLANGLLVDQPSPSARTAKRRRRPMWFIPAIVAKIASAGAVAQAATGAAIVVVGFTGAGAAGVLPEHIQHGFAVTVDTVTPFTVHDPDEAPVSPPAEAPTVPPATGETAGTQVTDQQVTDQTAGDGEKATGDSESGGAEVEQPTNAGTKAQPSWKPSKEAARSAYPDAKNYGEVVRQKNPGATKRADHQPATPGAEGNRKPQRPATGDQPDSGDQPVSGDQAGGDD